MTIIPIKTFEEMTKQEQREYLESLIEENILVDQEGNNVSPEEFLKEVPVDDILKRRRHKRQNGDGAYVTCRRIAELSGWGDDTVRRRFKNEKGVVKQTFAGRNRKSYTVMRVPKSVAKRVLPELEFDAPSK